MKKLVRTFLMVYLFLGFSGMAHGQEKEPAIQLTLSRTFGYGGIGQIQGTFTMKVSEPGEATRVEFLIDEQVVHVDEEAPFTFRFQTGDYSAGFHVI